MIKTLQLLLILFIISSNYSQAQSYKFVYRLNFRTDSTKIEDIKTELFTLYLNENISVFASQNKILIDSLRSETKNNQSLGLLLIANLSSVPRTKFRFVIFKNRQFKTCVTRQKVLSDNFEYEEPIDGFEWKFKNDTISLLGYKCKTASTKYCGRTYNAWYGEQVPVSDGPYKFTGLPGLIFKIVDLKNNFDFELIGIQKWDNKLPPLNNEQIIKTTKTKFIKANNSFSENYVNIAAQNGLILSDEGKKFMSEKNKLENTNPIELE